MSFIISPVADINISVGMIQSTFSFSFSMVKFASIGTGIREIDLSIAVFLAMVPLPKVIAIFVEFEGSKHMRVGIKINLWRFEFLIDHVLLFNDIPWEFVNR